MDGLRLAAVRITGDLMYQLFCASKPGQWFRVDKGLPADAEYVRSYYDDACNHFVFVYTHPSFPLTRPGDVVRHLPDVSVSQLSLTVPLGDAQCDAIESLIVEQSRREGQG